MYKSNCSGTCQTYGKQREQQQLESRDERRVPRHDRKLRSRTKVQVCHRSSLMNYETIIDVLPGRRLLNTRSSKKDEGVQDDHRDAIESSPGRHRLDQIKVRGILGSSTHYNLACLGLKIIPRSFERNRLLYLLLSFSFLLLLCLMSHVYLRQGRATPSAKSCYRV